MLDFDTETTPLIIREGFISSWTDWLTNWLTDRPTLERKALRSFATLAAINPTTQSNISEDQILRQHRRQNLKCG